ncbi:5-formyltetrahydrofolate cyclo-ligase [Cohnella soli]|uniref:5-formyltetrahydrofolate cyclo-ligase n=1 Tax=Cohnella soli TaxID=425005 RepID=A0ABW0HV09_9BACL
MTDHKFLESASKSEWRRRMAEARDGITPEERQRLSREISETIENDILRSLREKLGRSLRVALFAAFKSEASPFALFEFCRAAGDRTFATRMLDGGENLELREVEKITDWVGGRWGVPEPDPGITRPMNESEVLDVVIVPGLAFDRHGGRLGYGGGYYDRLYAELTGRMAYGTSEYRMLWIGFAFSVQLVNGRLPKELHDLQLDAVATDQGVVRLTCGDKGGSG